MRQITVECLRSHIVLLIMIENRLDVTSLMSHQHNEKGFTPIKLLFIYCYHVQCERSLCGERQIPN